MTFALNTMDTDHWMSTLVGSSEVNACADLALTCHNRLTVYVGHPRVTVDYRQYVCEHLSVRVPVETQSRPLCKKFQKSVISMHLNVLCEVNPVHLCTALFCAESLELLNTVFQ